MSYLGETGISLPRHTYRSPTALEGIAMLKRGCIATKYGRAGKPHKVTFTLSIDERTLSWKGNGLINSLIGKQPRSCALYTAVSLLIGRESAVFRRFQGVRAHARTRFQDDFAVAEDLPDEDEPHLSFSLRFGQSEERDTLDICFDDGQEELFGLWVAAVRALVPAQALGPDLRKAAVGQPTAAPGDASSAPQLVRPQAMPSPQPFDDLFASLSPASSATVECKPRAPPAEAVVQSPDWTRAPLPPSQPPPQPNAAAAVLQPPPRPPPAPPPRLPPTPPPQQPTPPTPPTPTPLTSTAPAPAPSSSPAPALARPAKPAPTPLAWKPPPEVLEEDDEEEPPPPPVVVPAAFGYVAPAGSTASSVSVAGGPALCAAGAPPASMAPVDWAGLLASTSGGSDSLRSMQVIGGSGGLGDLETLLSAQPPPSAGHGSIPTLAKTSRNPFSELAL